MGITGPVVAIRMPVCGYPDMKQALGQYREVETIEVYLAPGVLDCRKPCRFDSPVF
jgi:hypothetical protein